MKLIRNNIVPNAWNEIPFGICYRKILTYYLRSWWPKIFGFYLIKMGSLSVDFDTQNCPVSHQINIGQQGNNFHIIADFYQLPFANQSINACLLIHTLSYVHDPYLLLTEVNRVLMNNGWLIITTFNTISILSLGKIFPFIFRYYPYGSKMYTYMTLVQWLKIFNIEILSHACLQVFPCQFKEGLINTHFPIFGCLNVIISRKRSISIDLISIHHIINNQLLVPILT